MLKATGKSRRHAKALRRNMTLPEIILWRHLRKRQTGHHWRKQHPAGPYQLDFYCDSAKLCVEVDGEAHDRGDRPFRDARRDAWLAQHEIETLRVGSGDVLRNIESVILLIEAHARKRAPLHRPSDGPPPPAELGEDV